MQGAGRDGRTIRRLAIPAPPSPPMKLLDALRALVPTVAGRRSAPSDEGRRGEMKAWAGEPLVLLLQQVLAQEHQPAELHAGLVVLPDGIRLQAEFIEAVELGPSHFKTFTRIRATHPQAFPEGLFEFQHAAGASVEASLADGLRTWVRLDLLTLQDALRDEPRHCTVIDLPASQAPAGARRQVLLGPVGHLVAHPDPLTTPTPFDAGGLFEQCRAVFDELLRSDRFLGIRLFASRDAHGVAGADCRVNGEPFAPGAQCLQREVQAWPAQGLEFRKQYLVVRTLR